MIATATDVADAIFEQLKALKEMRTRAAKELGISFDLPEEMTVQGAIVTAAGINAVTRTDTVDQVGKDTTTETALKSTVLETRNTEDRKQNDGGSGKEFRTTTEEKLTMASITRTEGVETTNTTEGYREAGTGTVLNESTPGLKTVERTAPQQKSVSKEDLGITLAFTIKNITLC